MGDKNPPTSQTVFTIPLFRLCAMANQCTLILKRLGNILKNKNITVDVNVFLEKLEEKGLIKTVEEEELKLKKRYRDKIDGAFSILLRRNPHKTWRHMKRILLEMDRGDILKEVQSYVHIVILVRKSIRHHKF